MERLQGSAGDVLLPQLRAFAAVARTGSYARAAEELSYSEPAVFLQMRALEKVLGVRLVRRRKKQLLLTQQGEQLLELAVAVLNDAVRLEQVARALRGRIVVASGANTAVTWLLPLIARYEEAHPEHLLEVHTVDAQSLDSAVSEGLYDMTFGGVDRERPGRAEWRSRGLVSVPWIRDEWVVWEPSDLSRLLARHRTLRAAPIRVYYYGQWKRIPGEDIRSTLAARLGREVELTPVDSLELARGGVLAGLGLAILPRNCGLATEGFRILEGTPRGRMLISVVHRRPRELAPPVRSFLCFILQEGRRIRRN